MKGIFNSIKYFFIKNKVALGTDISNIGIALAIGSLFAVEHTSFAVYGIMVYCIGFYIRRKK